MKLTIRIFIEITLIIATCAMSLASESDTCKSYSENALNLIRASGNQDMLVAAGIVDHLISPASTQSEELISSASRIEFPKCAATVNMIVYRLNNGLPIKSSSEQITQLLYEDNDNALSYYLNALYQYEESNWKEALEQIKKGNLKPFNSYTKQRFHSIVEAAEMAECGGIKARQYAFSYAQDFIVYNKLGRLCRDLIGCCGQDAKEACLLLGKKLEYKSLTCLEKLISLNIQSKSLEGLSSSAEALKGIKEKKDEAVACGKHMSEKDMSELFFSGKYSTEVISETDVTETLISQYYEILLEKGEASAQEFLFQQVKSRKQ